MRLKEIYQIAQNSNSSYLLHFFKESVFKLKFQTAPDLLYMYLSNGYNFFFDDNGRLFKRFIITCYNTIAKLF